MASCNHTRWLRLRKNKYDVMLEASDRPMRLLDDLARPEEPAGLVLLLGSHHKAQLLRRLGDGPAPTKSRRSHGEIHLTVSSLDDGNQWPVIVADGDLPSHNRLPIARTPHRCHEAIEQRVPELQPGAGVAPVADDMCHRLLLPFVDVVCLFVPDIGGVECAIQRLTAWLEKGPASTCPVRPQLVLAVSQGQEGDMRTALDSTIRNAALNQCFQRVRVVGLPDGQTEAAGRARRVPPVGALEGELASSLGLVQDARKQGGYLLSARHTARLLCASAARAADVPLQPIDLIKISRGGQPVAADLASHLVNALELADALDDTPASTAALISSSFLLDQYPAGAHRKSAASVVRGH